MARPICKDYVARFWSKVTRHRSKKVCWTWNAGRDKDGYGVYYAGYATRAHIYSWVIHYGSTKGLWVLHKCDNPSCVNPYHLFLGRNKENVEDRVRKGRTACGKSHGSKTHPECIERGTKHWSRRRPELVKRGSARFNTKLNETDVDAIRKALMDYRFGLGIELARKYNVHPALISQIRRGKAWT